MIISRTSRPVTCAVFLAAAVLLAVPAAAQMGAPPTTLQAALAKDAGTLSDKFAGLAGLVSTSVSQRTREFGLRIALGASRGAVLRMVLSQGTWLVAAGIALGAAGAYWFARLIARFLFATPPTDPVAYLLVALVLVGAALVATVGPAIRATAIDPLTTLKDG